jgi:hypothetical protein
MRPYSSNFICWVAKIDFSPLTPKLGGIIKNQANIISLKVLLSMVYSLVFCVSSESS